MAGITQKTVWLYFHCGPFKKQKKKTKPNITSFLTLPHPLHCLICAKDIMVIVLLLQVMGGDEKVGGWFIYLRVWAGGQGWVYFFSIFCSVFCAVVNCSFMAGT